MARTVWLASYPKSGNTWFRIFFANLLHAGDEPLDFNSLRADAPIASSRMHFDDMLGVPSALLTAAEIARLRPAADEELNRVREEPLLLRKAHDAYTWLGDGRPLLGQAPGFAAIYILRQPWDVAVSLANHFSCTLDEAVAKLCDPAFVMAGNEKRLSNQLPQRLLSWEGHALSWLEAPLPVHLMRYEQMRGDPLPTFRAAVRFLGLPHDDTKIAAALEASRFKRMQQLEAETRFREAPRQTRRFFRGGRVGDGLAALGQDQIERLRAMHARVERALAARD